MESWFKAKVETEKEYPELGRKSGESYITKAKEEANNQCPQVQARKICRL